MRKPWTQQELQVLRDLYPDMKCADVAARLGRTASSVYQTAARLGIEKSDSFKASELSGRAARGRQHPAIVASQIKTGTPAWNKGRKGVNGFSSTRFKPGRPASEARNYQPIGTLRLDKDGNLTQKVSDSPKRSARWVPVHRLVWEAANGPIPAGHIVRFLPGMKTTELTLITADRLECISRVENARRNHPRSYSPELGRLVQLKGAITRQINRISREAKGQAV